MARPNSDTVMTIPAKYNMVSIPITHGINMNPSTNVTDPPSMSAIETPSIKDATAAGDACGSLRRRGVGRGER